VPMIQNINSSTTPTSPLGLPIEINGSGFQAAPGKVNFTQGSTSLDVCQSGCAWSDTGIVAIIPATLTAPGQVNVTVVTTGGKSNAKTVNLIQTLSFNPSLMGWTTTMALPKAMTGLRAVGVTGSTSSTAFAIVTGGFDGTANTTTVLANNLNQDGTVGNTTNTTWTTITINPLPDTRAHHAMAVADPTNSLVAANARFVYVLGGQKLSTDAPGGTNTVFMASVDPTTGAVGAWQTLTSLPQELVGLSATVYNGFLYVAGGLGGGTNTPTAKVYSAPVNAEGTIGTWTTATNALPAATSFGTMFAFGGKLYFIDGDPNNSTAPNDQDTGTTNVALANITRGVVGTWASTSPTIHNRSKGILWSAFGQVISAEGIYSGNAGGCPASGESEVTTVNGDGTLAGWNGLTGSNVPCANVYNAAAFLSPLISATQTPRFLLLGGQAFTGITGAGGTLSSTVFVNNAP
jgi:IPT/TIG domain-containing protein